MHRSTPCHALLLAGLLVGGTPLHAQDLAIVGVRVVDVVRGRTVPGQTILVHDGRITWVGPSAQASRPAGIRVIPGRGRVVIPGLWDMHVHVDDGGRWMLPLLVRAGVTGVRDMGSTPGLVASWHARPSSFPVPRLVIAGPIVTGVVPDSDIRVVQVADSAAAVQTVDRLVSSGVDFIKVHDWLAPPAYHALLGEAGKRGIPVAGHLPVAIGALEAVQAGQRSIEHLGNARGGLLLDCQPDPTEWRRRMWEYRSSPYVAAALIGGMPDSLLRRLLQGCSSTRLHELAAGLARTEVFITPVFLSTYRLGLRGMPDAIRADTTLSLLPRALDSLGRELRRPDEPPAQTSHDSLVQSLFARYQAMVRALAAAGVPLLAGTDVAPWPQHLPGTSLHQELAELVAAGLTPAQALRTATLEPARYLKATDSLGTVAPGRVADLVLLDGDPLQDIRNTSRISAVMLRGVLLDQEALVRLGELARRAPVVDPGPDSP